jgi:anaerobic selenocysteine-containing dehydrogenase
MPPEHRYMRNCNRGYIAWAREMHLRAFAEPALIQIYSEPMQEFRLAAQGKRAGRKPPEALRERIERYFDPLPFYYAPLEAQATDAERFPLAAITQRPMAMYHSWDSQNAWLRQIHGYNYLFVSPRTASEAGIADGGWMWAESQWGKVRCMARYSEAVEPGTVWTWNAIGKAPGAWRLAPDAEEARLGFLLNHLISDELPSGAGSISNSDPVTGQAGWYDVRVRIRPAEPGEAAETFPRFDEVPALPGTLRKLPSWIAYLAPGRKSP